MKVSVILSFFIFLNITGIINAREDSSTYAAAIQRNADFYAFYVILHQKDSVLIRKDSLEDVYYGARKIPDSIKIEINPYNNDQLLLYWTEHNTLSEGESGSDGTMKKYIAILDLEQQQVIFRYEYYFAETGWQSEMNGENGGLKTGSYEKIIRNDTIAFSNQRITVKNVPDKKVITFLYSPYQKKYIQE